MHGFIKIIPTITLFLLITLGVIGEPLNDATFIIDNDVDVSAFVWSLDGQKIITAGRDGRVRYFEMSHTDQPSLKAVRAITLGRDCRRIDDIAVNSEGDVAFVGCGAHLYDLIKPNRVGIISAASNNIHWLKDITTTHSKIAWNEDASLIAVGGWDGWNSKIYIWDLASGAIVDTANLEPASRHDEPLYVQDLHWLSKSNRLVFGTSWKWSWGLLEWIELEARGVGWTISLRDSLAGPTLYPVTSIDINTLQTRVVVGHEAGSITIWDTAETQAWPPVCEVPFNQSVADIAFEPNSDRFAVLGRGGRLSINSCGADKPPIWEIPEANHFTISLPQLAWSPDGKFLAVSAADNFIWIWAIQSLE